MNTFFFCKTVEKKPNHSRSCAVLRCR